MSTETFQITLTSEPRSGVDRAGRQVTDVRADVVRRVGREGDEWEPTGRHPVHVRARGEFAEHLVAHTHEGDDLIVAGQVIDPKPGGDLFDEDGPLPRLLAVVVARPLF